MAGLDNIVRAGIGADRRQHRHCAIRRRDAGGHALGGLDRQREIGAHRRAVVADHQRQIQLPAAFLGQRQADQAATETRHEIDGLGCREFRR